MIDFIITHASAIALLGFFSGFVFILVSVMRPSRKAALQKHAQIPFEENQ